MTGGLGAVAGRLLADVAPSPSSGEITGIVVGAIAVAAVIALVVWRVAVGKKKR